MSSQFLGFLSMFFLIYIAGNYYIGRRMLQSFSCFITRAYTKVYWLLFSLAALSLVIGRLSGVYFPGIISDGVTLFADYWMGAVYYLVLLWLVIDTCRWLIRQLGFNLGFIQPNRIYPGLLVVVVVSILLLYGSWNARNPQIQHYDVTIAKQAGDLRQLHVVMVSDIHLGSIVDNARLEGLVASINQLDPDVVLFAGDIIDENVNYFAEQRMPDTFRKLKPRFGTYACFGNHDYLGGQAEQVKDYLLDAGVVVLRDSHVRINEQFYIVGRDDRTRQRVSGKPRLELGKVLAGVDHSLPIILLDHQPYNLEEGVQQGVDLQLSGHTHRGQFFPNNFITHWIYKNDWGYLKQDSFQVIVSSGFGTWGPPIRIGNTPEIVDIVIRFSK